MNKIEFGDCRQIMRRWAVDGVKAHTCVTSPPYWGLRDYGVEGQLGQEETPEEFIANMVEVFRCVRDILRDDGTLWLNLGDSYAGAPGGYQGKNGQRFSRTFTAKIDHHKKGNGLKPKDLVGIPWRVALALQADGWYLRQDIIWSKPNPMPESVTDRCTKSHEYIFLLSKSAQYYFDAELIIERASPNTHARLAQNVQAQIGSARAHGGEKKVMKAVGRKFDPGGGNKNNESFDAAIAIMPEKRNKRSVWTVSTKPYKGAHFATYPADLIMPCILAGSPAGGIVMDPFMGSGTTAYAAQQSGRKYIGCELKHDYKALQDERLRQEILI